MEPEDPRQYDNKEKYPVKPGIDFIIKLADVPGALAKA